MLTAALTAAAAPQALERVPMKLVNNTVFADNEIYIAIIGKVGDSDIYYDLSANNSGNTGTKPLTTSLNTMHVKADD